jgi:hypothetical protein
MIFARVAGRNDFNDLACAKDTCEMNARFPAQELHGLATDTCAV